MKVTVVVAGDSLYGIPINHVQEFDFEYAMTPIPFSDIRVEGVSSLRGRIITLINLRKCLGLEYSTQKSRRKVVVLDTDCLCEESEFLDYKISKELVGVVVDRIEGVVDLDIKDNIVDRVDQNNKQYVKGVFYYKDKVLNLLSFSIIVRDIYKGSSL